MPLPNVWVRIIVGVTLIPAILLVIWAGGAAVAVFTGLITLTGLWEFYRLAVAKGLDPNRFLGLSGGLAIVGDAWIEAGQAVAGILAAVVVTTVAVEIVRKRQSSAILNAAATVCGVLYVGWLGSHLILLRELPATRAGFEAADGFGLLLLAFLIPWSCDTAAYFTGRWFGAHKLIPRVSPGKTVEGAIGGVAGAIAVVVGLRSWGFPFLSVMHCVVLGLAGGILSQIGDLAESLMKRDAGIKDVSHMVPGHGGVLDRFDSVLFSAPFVYYYMILCVA